ncbi:uncharacterized protein LOC101770340 isoform X2 [Setaria italica]|uniref:uncharacterized protein LOC101770340 isoform X2 n=1 Tax=Setaria italica TaxID=4555 RepID=UPI000BE519AC|nr:uncharacterized protein LOC101770340 isoform X2 [Setaria italica]
MSSMMKIGLLPVMEATVMEMHRCVSEFTEVSFPPLCCFRLEIGTRSSLEIMSSMMKIGLLPVMEVTVMEMHRRVSEFTESKIIQGHGDTIMRAQALEHELAKERQYSSRLLMKYDSQAVQYRNAVQKAMEEKDRLQKRNKELNNRLEELTKK